MGRNSSPNVRVGRPVGGDQTRPPPAVEARPCRGLSCPAASLTLLLAAAPCPPLHRCRTRRAPAKPCAAAGAPAVRFLDRPVGRDPAERQARRAQPDRADPRRLCAAGELDGCRGAATGRATTPTTRAHRWHQTWVDNRASVSCSRGLRRRQDGARGRDRDSTGGKSAEADHLAGDVARRTCGSSGRARATAGPPGRRRSTAGT